jgi:hypothetical protein
LARKSTSPNGHARVEEAIATLVQNHAEFVRPLGDDERPRLEFQREANARFASFEEKMIEIIHVLTKHSRQLERLTMIGFKGQQ